MRGMARNKRSAETSAPQEPRKQAHHDPGKQALADLEPTMAQLGKDGLLSMRTDVHAAANATLLRAIEFQNPPLAERVASLPAGEFDPASLTLTEQASRACLELLALQRASAAQPSEARVDASLVADGTRRKVRMMRLLDHYFEDDAQIGLELADIRLGSGHADLASDLRRLSSLYSKPRIHAVVSRDPKFFDPTDEAEARRIAQAIDEQLDGHHNTDQRSLSLRLAQAWTLLDRGYSQLRRAATFLFWDDDDALRRYPLLFTLGRPAASAPAAPTGASAPGGVSPAEGDGKKKGKKR